MEIGSVSNEESVEQVLSWSLMPNAPKIIFMYISSIDTSGHRHGPYSKELNSSLIELDDAIGRLVKGLKHECRQTNLLVVSDHGMAATSDDKIIRLVELVPLEYLEHFDGGAVVSLWPKKGKEDVVLERLRSKQSKLYPHHFEIYQSKSDLNKYPFHYSKSVRIAPIILQCEPGWMICK